MGTMRGHWQAAKKAMEAEPKMGKDWVSKTFKDDLGPKLDDLERQWDAQIALTRSIQKLIDEFEASSKKSEALFSEASDKIAVYRKAIAAKVAQEKLKNIGAYSGPLTSITDNGRTVTQSLKKLVFDAASGLSAVERRMFGGR